MRPTFKERQTAERALRNALRRVLASEDGRLLIEALEKQFDRALFAETSEKTAYRVGQRDVVRWLLDVRDAPEQE